MQKKKTSKRILSIYAKKFPTLVKYIHFLKDKIAKIDSRKTENRPGWCSSVDCEGLRTKGLQV